MKLFKKVLIASVAISALKSVQPAELQSNSNSASIGIEGQINNNIYHYQDTKRLEGGLNIVPFGIVYGINGAIQHKEVMFAALETRYLFRRHKHNRADLHEPRALAGFVFHLNESLKLIPYTGLGLRYKKTSAENTIYKQTSKEKITYLPLGVKFESQFFGNGFSLNAEYDYILNGHAKNTHSILKYPAPKTHSKISGCGYKGNIELKVKTNKQFTLGFGPYVNFWNEKQQHNYQIASDHITLENVKNLETGLKLRVII